MKQKTRAFISKILVVSMAASLVLCCACGGKTGSQASTLAPTVSPLANFGNITVDVLGAGNFEGFNQTFHYPIDYYFPPISITWMRLIFNGLLQGAGPGSDTTYKVHGSISADGAWIESIIFSEEVYSTAGYPYFYQVTLNNIPLTRSLDPNGIDQAFCKKSSSDVQRFVGQIQYVDGGGFTYQGTDFGDPNCPARLTVKLAPGPGISSGDNKAYQNPGIIC